MTCQTCSSPRVLGVSGHASDCFCWSMGNKNGSGYLPKDFGIGGGDDMEIDVCLDCGQLQGKWPLTTSSFEEGESDES